MPPSPAPASRRGHPRAPARLGVDGPVLVEGGHFTLATRRPDAADGEGVELPGGGLWWAGTTETTRACLALAVEETRRLRAQGRVARVGLMVGDLALSAGTRPSGGSWALPPSYRAILVEGGLAPEDVLVWGEAYARNQGKRRLLDEARRLHPSARASYAAWGWALLHDAEGIRLASDASLDWDGDIRAAVLTRGRMPLCPLVFAGLKRAVFQAGFVRHVAIYARADDPWIDVKLRAAATIIGQLRLGAVGEQVDWILSAADSAPSESTWSVSDLVAPGERDWPDFLAEVRVHHPGISDLESRCPPTLTPSPCGAPTTASLSSG